MTPKQSKFIDDILELFDQRSHSSMDSKYECDRALWHLLTLHRHQLPVMDADFHNAFSLVDVTDSGNSDMAIWLLLHHSDLFWECLHECRRRNRKPRKPKVKERDEKN